MLPAITATFGTPTFETKAVGDASSVSAPSPWGFDMWGDLRAIAGPTVNASTAMTVPAVASCVRLVANALSSLPVHVLKAVPEGGQAPDPDHPAYGLVRRDACPWLSASDLRNKLLTDALLHGFGVAQAVRGSDNQVKELHRLIPGSVSIEFDTFTAEPLFRVSTDGTNNVLDFRDVLYIPAPCSPDPYRPIAPIILARNAIGLALALEAHASRLFANGGRPSGVLASDKTLDTKTIARVAASWAAAHSGENSGATAVLEQGMKFQQLAFDCVSSQFLELRRFAVEEIARVFEVPVTMIGDISQASKNNSESLNRIFYQTCLLSWITTFEDAYRRLLIPAEEQGTFSVGFDVDELLRADSTARAQLIVALRSTGAATANDIRRLQGWPALKGGDVLGSPYTASGSQPAPEAQPANV